MKLSDKPRHYAPQKHRGGFNSTEPGGRYLPGIPRSLRSPVALMFDAASEISLLAAILGAIRRRPRA